MVCSVKLLTFVSRLTIYVAIADRLIVRRI